MCTIKDGSSSQLPSCDHTVTIMIPRCFMMFLCGRARSGRRKVLEALVRYEKAGVKEIIGDHRRSSDLVQIFGTTAQNSPETIRNL